MNTTFKKTVAAGVAALALAVAVTASSTPAAAWSKKLGPGPFIGGLIGGMITSAIIAGSSGPDDGDCYITRQPVYDAGGNFLGMQPTRVCN
jgi:hypothetical protein